MPKINYLSMTVNSMAELLEAVKNLPGDIDQLNISVSSVGAAPDSTVPPPVPVPEEDEPPAEPLPVYRMEDVRAALAKVRDLLGVEGMRDLMRPYGTEKLAGLSAEHYGDVLEAAQKVTADAC